GRRAYRGRGGREIRRRDTGGAGRMTGWPVTIDELNREGVVRSLSHVEAAMLAGTKLVEVRPEGGQSWRILPAGNVGATRIGDKQVQVMPKGRVGVAHLLFLLGYAKTPGFREEDVLGVRDDD